MSLPLFEKYRPRNIEDMILEPVIKAKLSNMIKNKELSNLIIIGNSGVGKTTLINIITNKLYGKQQDQGVQELNASDEKVIKIVQDNLESFCKRIVDYGTESDKYPIFKLIILDEADNMTTKVQFKINKLMREFNKTTRFVFTCNKLNNIEDALQSNCNIIYLPIISQDDITNRLEIICKNEKINYDVESLELIAKDSKGDIRIAINNLQLINNNRHEIEIDYVKLFFGRRIVENIDKIFKLCNKRKFKEALKFAIFIKNEGYSIFDIVQLMAERLRDENYDNLSDDKKIKYFDVIGLTLYSLSKGIDSDIQLSACIANMANIE